jgi:hypothetical protein
MEHCSEPSVSNLLLDLVIGIYKRYRRVRGGARPAAPEGVVTYLKAYLTAIRLDTLDYYRGGTLKFRRELMNNVTMRDYQMQGLSWLVHLYDNGIRQRRPRRRDG